MRQKELVLDDLAAEYDEQKDPSLSRLYSHEERRLVPMFSAFHRRLNSLFGFMNLKIIRNRHYNADESRALIDLIAEISQKRALLRKVGIDLEVDEPYSEILTSCERFLRSSGGSTIPEEFQPIEVEEYDPVFESQNSRAHLEGRRRSFPLIMVGEGSYAFVYKYLDEDYGFYVAQKRAKKTLGAKEIERFRREYELLARLRFPYVVQAYAYDETAHSYTMEYCDSTLGEYIDRHNATLPWKARWKITLQFLYGLNYIHSKGLLHRDLSRRNILIKEFDGRAVVVKLSDFGLHKDPEAEVTSTDSSMKGTIRDPTLSRFSDYDELSDIHAAGCLLSYIFSGRDGLAACSGRVQQIVSKCTANNRLERYRDVMSLLADVEVLRDESEEASSDAST